MVITFFTWLATALSLLLVDLAVPGVDIATFPAALIAAVAIGLLNSSIKPILSQLSLPLNYSTLGLFSIVVNGVCFWLATVLVPGTAKSTSSRLRAVANQVKKVITITFSQISNRRF